jgi:hypothetical protein
LRRTICTEERPSTLSKNPTELASESKDTSAVIDQQVEEDISFRALELSLKANYVFKESAEGDRNEKIFLDCTRMVAVLEDKKKIDDMLADSCNNMAACCEVLDMYYTDRSISLLR